MPNIDRADKVVNPSLKPETEVKREGIPKATLMIIQSIPKLEETFPSKIPRRGLGRAGVRRKIVAPEIQPIPQLKVKNISLPRVLSKLETPITDTA